MEIKVGTRKCILPGCDRTFAPIVSWQRCCSAQHGARLRWLKRRDRINAALRLAEGVGKQ
jgi:hypothetical protein